MWTSLKATQFLSLMYILFLTFESINWEWGSVWGNDSSLEMAHIACCSGFGILFHSQLLLLLIFFPFTLSHKYVASPIVFGAWTQTIFHVFSYLKIERNTTCINEASTSPLLLAAHYQQTSSPLLSVTLTTFFTFIYHPNHMSDLKYSLENFGSLCKYVTCQPGTTTSICTDAAAWREG